MIWSVAKHNLENWSQLHVPGPLPEIRQPDTSAGTPVPSATAQGSKTEACASQRPGAWRPIGWYPRPNATNERHKRTGGEGGRETRRRQKRRFNARSTTTAVDVK